MAENDLSGGIIVHKIDVSSIDGMSELYDFYSNVMMPSFPCNDERDDFSDILSYLRNSKKDDSWEYTCAVSVDKGGNVIGGIVFDWFLDIGAIAIEYVCVRDGARRMGIADALVDFAENYCKGTTFAYCEVEKPCMSSDSLFPHLRFWSHRGFERVVCNYVQPELTQYRGDRKCTGLWLAGKALSHECEITLHSVSQFLDRYFRKSFGIAKPERRDEYADVISTYSGTLGLL